MRTFYFLSFCFSVQLLFCSCQKNIDQFVPDLIQPSADTVWQSNVAADAAVNALKSELKIPRVTDSFSYSNTGVVFTSGNISLGVPANGLVKTNGTVPVGNIKRESLLVQKKGDFITMNMPTTINGRLLVTGGAFFMGLKNNNDDLAVSQGSKLTVKFNTSDPAQNNNIYNAIIDSASGAFIRWELNNDTAFNKSLVAANGYEIQTSKLNYVQTAHLLDTAGVVQTTLSVKLPANYTNSNTIVFLSFNTIETVAALVPSIVSKNFVSSTLPINKAVTIVVISKQGADYYLGTTQTITSVSAAGTAAQVQNIVPIKKSLENIKIYLNSL